MERSLLRARSDQLVADPMLKGKGQILISLAWSAMEASVITQFTLVCYSSSLSSDPTKMTWFCDPGHRIFASMYSEGKS